MPKRIKKIMVGFPPIESNKGTPLIAHNRLFQWSRIPAFTYPVVPALAASMLAQKGYAVVFKDAIAERSTVMQWLDYVEAEKPDLILFEVKTPVVKYYWDIVDSLKSRFKSVHVALAGDHVTALPEEAFARSMVDFVLTGGDFDFLLCNLVEHLNSGTALEPGIYHRSGGEIGNTGRYQPTHDINAQSFIDRDLTNWKRYAADNGSYRRLPGTSIMAARDCSFHACTFCSWTTLYDNFRARSPEHVVDEIEMLAQKYHIRAIVDESGCFPTGEWLTAFCRLMMQRKLNRRVALSATVFPGACSFDDFRLMRKAGFHSVRLCIFSANQSTLDRIAKGVNAGVIEQSCRNARRAGLLPEISVLFGFPWETEDEAMSTLMLARKLMLHGYVHNAAGGIVIPYPGTALYAECEANGTLAVREWERYDMRDAVMKSPITGAELRHMVKELYALHFHPLSLLHKLITVRDADDIMYHYRTFHAIFFGHLKGFV
ncbi:MAG: radical SAM protein [Spirochaetes bacterium]|nr:radical SAM protein [Spirochaetota bacterium]